MVTNVKITSKTGGSMNLPLTGDIDKNSLLMEIDGIDPPDATVNITEYAALDGGFFNSSRQGLRNITLNIKLGTSPSMQYHRDKLYSVCNPGDAVTLLVYITSNNQSTGGTAKQFTGYVESVECDYWGEDERATVSIVCPNSDYVSGSIVQRDYYITSGSKTATTKEDDDSSSTTTTTDTSSSSDTSTTETQTTVIPDDIYSEDSDTTIYKKILVATEEEVQETTKDHIKFAIAPYAYFSPVHALDYCYASNGTYRHNNITMMIKYDSETGNFVPDSGFMKNLSLNKWLKRMDCQNNDGNDYTPAQSWQMKTWQDNSFYYSPDADYTKDTALYNNKPSDWDENWSNYSFRSEDYSEYSGITNPWYHESDYRRYTSYGDYYIDYVWRYNNLKNRYECMDIDSIVPSDYESTYDDYYILPGYRTIKNICKKQAPLNYMSDSLTSKYHTLKADTNSLKLFRWCYAYGKDEQDTTTVNGITYASSYVCFKLTDEFKNKIRSIPGYSDIVFTGHALDTRLGVIRTSAEKLNPLCIYNDTYHYDSVNEDLEDYRIGYVQGRSGNIYGAGTTESPYTFGGTTSSEPEKTFADQYADDFISYSGHDSTHGDSYNYIYSAFPDLSQVTNTSDSPAKLVDLNGNDVSINDVAHKTTISEYIAEDAWDSWQAKYFRDLSIYDCWCVIQLGYLPGYEKNGATNSEYESNTYYSRNASTDEYTLLTSKPNDWDIDNGFVNYYHKAATSSRPYKNAKIINGVFYIQKEETAITYTNKSVELKFVEKEVVRSEEDDLERASGKYYIKNDNFSTNLNALLYNRSTDTVLYSNGDLFGDPTVVNCTASTLIPYKDTLTSDSTKSASINVFESVDKSIDEATATAIGIDAYRTTVDSSGNVVTEPYQEIEKYTYGNVGEFSNGDHGLAYIRDDTDVTSTTVAGGKCTETYAETELLNIPCGNYAQTDDMKKLIAVATTNEDSQILVRRSTNESPLTVGNLYEYESVDSATYVEGQYYYYDQDAADADGFASLSGKYPAYYKVINTSGDFDRYTKKYTALTSPQTFAADTYYYVSFTYPTTSYKGPMNDSWQNIIKTPANFSDQYTDPYAFPVVYGLKTFIDSRYPSSGDGSTHWRRLDSSYCANLTKNYTEMPEWKSGLYYSMVDDTLTILTEKPNNWDAAADLSTNLTTYYIIDNGKWYGTQILDDTYIWRKETYNWGDNYISTPNYIVDTTERTAADTFDIITTKGTQLSSAQTYAANSFGTLERTYERKHMPMKINTDGTYVSSPSWLTDDVTEDAYYYQYKNCALGGWTKIKKTDTLYTYTDNKDKYRGLPLYGFYPLKYEAITDLSSYTGTIYNKIHTSPDEYAEIDSNDVVAGTTYYKRVTNNNFVMLNTFSYNEYATMAAFHTSEATKDGKNPESLSKTYEAYRRYIYRNSSFDDGHYDDMLESIVYEYTPIAENAVYEQNKYYKKTSNYISIYAMGINTQTMSSSNQYIDVYGGTYAYYPIYTQVTSATAPDDFVTNASLYYTRDRKDADAPDGLYYCDPTFIDCCYDGPIYEYTRLTSSTAPADFASSYSNYYSLSRDYSRICVTYIVNTTDTSKLKEYTLLSADNGQLATNPEYYYTLSSDYSNIYTRSGNKYKNIDFNHDSCNTPLSTDMPLGMFMSGDRLGFDSYHMSNLFLSDSAITSTSATGQYIRFEQLTAAPTKLVPGYYWKLVDGEYTLINDYTELSDISTNWTSYYRKVYRNVSTVLPKMILISKTVGKDSKPTFELDVDNYDLFVSDFNTWCKKVFEESTTSTLLYSVKNAPWVHDGDYSMYKSESSELDDYEVCKTKLVREDGFTTYDVTDFLTLGLCEQNGLEYYSATDKQIESLYSTFIDITGSASKEEEAASGKKDNYFYFGKQKDYVVVSKNNGTYIMQDDSFNGDYFPSKLSEPAYINLNAPTQNYIFGVAIQEA